MPLQVYDSGLDMGTRYLTKEVAYFLGGIYAADESVNSQGQLYWASPVRYNPQYSTNAQTTEHFDNVCVISACVNGYTVMKENIVGTQLDSGKNRLPGFSSFFRATSLTDLNRGIPDLRSALLASDDDIKMAFIIGVVDGRGTPDVNIPNGTIRYLSLDCPTNEIGYFLEEMVNDYGLRTNYNTARDRLEGGRPRKPQLRIKDVDLYMSDLGYISPAKFDTMVSVYDRKYGHHTITNNDALLTGLKCLRG